jgi:hypothetical protein
MQEDEEEVFRQPMAEVVAEEQEVPERTVLIRKEEMEE